MAYNITFGFDSDKIDLSIADNHANITGLIESINNLYRDTTRVATQIVIDSYTSPEGGASYNKKLSERRSKSLYNYIHSRTKFNRDIYKVNSTGINWGRLIELVEESDMDYKSEVLTILRYTPEETWTKLPNAKWESLVDSRNKQLMDLQGGVPYKYMERHFFPQLRIGSAVNVYYKQAVDTVVNTVYVNTVDTLIMRDTQYVEVTPELSKKSILAIKTNLLSDIFLIPSIEVEVPIGDRVSINAEYSRIWWLKNDNSRCWEYASYGIEGRYWFGDREILGRLNGFFAGLYAGYATYDLQLKSDSGYQGSVDYSVGLTGGYSLSLSDNFNIEFSAAIGYIDGSNSKYNVVDEVLYYNGQTKSLPAFLLTKAKISFVWRINSQK